MGNHAIASALVLLFATGCYSSQGGDDDGQSDAARDAADGRADAFDSTDAIDSTEADADGATDGVAPPDGAECLTDDDCVVVLHQDRCCNPDAMAVSRTVMAGDPCLHELGAPWVDSPGCLPIPCAWCPPITERFYAARCRGGTCVGGADFCPPMEAPPAAVEGPAGVTPRGGWEQYRGRVGFLSGNQTLGPDACACCEECDCGCFDNPVQTTLDCAFVVQGSVCGTPWNCTGTECSPSCTPPLRRGEYLTVTGYLVDFEGGARGRTWEIWPVTMANDCPPAGPNPAGSPCTGFEGDEQCAAGLFCIYFYDVVAPCTGTCRPQGTDCVSDTDCGPWEWCQHGYCGPMGG